MDALRELFTTWVGLASFAVLAGVVVMGFVMNRWVAAQVAREEAQRAGKAR